MTEKAEKAEMIVRTGKAIMTGAVSMKGRERTDGY
jgi:hypothetical protein